MQKQKVRMVWIRHDYNKDGIAELLFCIVVGKEVPFVEECNSIPVASIVPTPLPHRHIGLSIRDAVTDLQRINTVLWRQVLNNMYLANNGRYGVSDKVNLDDMLVSRAGGLVRVNGIPSQEIFPFQHPFIAQHGIAMMEFVEEKRENRTGTNRYFSGTDQGAGNKTASGMAMLTSAASQRVEMVARIVAEGVKELFLIVHELTIKHADATRRDKVRLRNEWVPIDPSTWKKRSDLKIAVGLGTGNKEVMGQNLANIYMAQKEVLPLGISSPRKIGNTLEEMTKNYGFANPDQFWDKPPEGPMQPPKDPKMAQVEANAAAGQAKLQADQQAQQAKMQMDAQAKARQQDIDAMLDAQKQQRATELEQFKSMLKEQSAERDAIRERDFQEWKAMLAAQTQVITAQISAGATVQTSQITAANAASQA
jgi:hypothetical protein